MPICPQCKYEYVQGAEKCPDCDVALQTALSPEEMAPRYELVTIFTSSNAMELALVKSFLEGSAIECFANGQRFANLYLNVAGLGDVDLQVPKHQEREAREILKELQEAEPETGSQEA